MLIDRLYTMTVCLKVYVLLCLEQKATSKMTIPPLEPFHVFPWRSCINFAFTSQMYVVHGEPISCLFKEMIDVRVDIYIYTQVHISATVPPGTGCVS